MAPDQTLLAAQARLEARQRALGIPVPAEAEASEAEPVPCPACGEASLELRGGTYYCPQDPYLCVFSVEAATLNAIRARVLRKEADRLQQVEDDDPWGALPYGWRLCVDMLRAHADLAERGE